MVFGYYTDEYGQHCDNCEALLRDCNCCECVSGNSMYTCCYEEEQEDEIEEWFDDEGTYCWHNYTTDDYYYGNGTIKKD